MTYILITPIKDEAKNIPKLKETIFNQTIKPLIWVICDGNSQDGSFQIANDLFKDYGWIHVIKQKTFFENGYSHKNIAGGLNDCYKYAKEMAYKNDIKYFYVARTDSTPILSDNYFEILIDEMEKEPKLAFICGEEIFQLKNSTIRYNQVAGISKTGINDIGIYRKDFLEEMNGFPITYMPETVLQIKASNKGWDIKRTNRTHFIEPRLGGSKIGVWNGYKLKGRAMYTLGYPVPLLLFSTLHYCYKYTPKSIVILYGYFSNVINRKEKIKDQEVSTYFENRLNRVFLDFTQYVYCRVYLFYSHLSGQKKYK